MGARILAFGLIIVAAACSRPSDDVLVEEALDERAPKPELALTPPSEAVPVASDIETHPSTSAALAEPPVPTARPDATPQPIPEPLANDHEGEIDAAPAAAPAPVASHVHPRAADADVSAPTDGGGKPQGVSTGLGPVPDRGWGGSGIIDDPDPLPGPGDMMGGVGRGGAVIVRGGAGGVHDDCAKHPRGGTMAGPSGPETLVNDRDPRRGALINERSPRTSRGPSLPRGGGFRGGIR